MPDPTEHLVMPEREAVLDLRANARFLATEKVEGQTAHVMSFPCTGAHRSGLRAALDLAEYLTDPEVQYALRMAATDRRLTKIQRDRLRPLLTNSEEASDDD